MTPRRSFFAWLMSHLARSRAAKLAVFMLVLIAAATIALLVLPVDGDLRVLAGMLGGLGLLTVAGLYLAYRTLNFARGMAAEAATLKASLKETNERLDRAERLRNAERLQIADELRRQANDAENNLIANFQAFERGLTQSGDLRGDLRHMQSALGATQSLVARTVAQGDALAHRLAAATAAIETLQAQLNGGKQSPDSRAMQGGATEGAEPVGVLGDLRRRSAEIEGRVEDLSRLLGVVASSSGESAQKLDELAQGMSASQAADRHIIARLQREIVVLSEVHASANERTRLVAEQAAEAMRGIHEINSRQGVLEQGVSAIVADAAVTFQRLVALDHKVGDSLTAIDTATKSRHEQLSGEVELLRLANQRVAEIASAVSAIELRQKAFDGEVAADRTQAKARDGQVAEELTQLKLASQNVAQVAGRLLTLEERHKALDGAFAAEKTQAKARHDALSSEVQQLKTAGQQAQVTATALQQRQAILDGGLDAVRSDISSANARVDQLLEGLRAVGSEASRIAAAAADLDTRQERLAGAVDQVGRELTKVAARADECATGLAATSRKGDEATSGLKNLTEATTARLSQLEERLKGVDAKADAKSVVELTTRQDQLADAINKAQQEIHKATAANADCMNRVAEAARQAQAAATGLRDLADTTTTRFLQVDDRIRTVVAASETSTAAGEQVAQNLSAAEQRIAAVEAGAIAVGKAQDQLGDRVELVSRRSEDAAASAARAEARLSELAVKLGLAVETGAATAMRLNELDSAVAAIGTSADALRADQVASASALTGRLDAVAADVALVRTALDQHASTLAAQLSALDARTERSAGVERITTIEADIAQIVRMVDDAEVAFADEVTRLAAAVSKLSEDVSQVGKQAGDGPAAMDAKLNAMQKTLSETIGANVEGRLAAAEKDIARTSRLINESEVATVAELTQLSAAVLQLRDDMQKSAEPQRPTPDDAASLIGPLRMQLAKAANQLEEAVRDTERALDEIGRDKRRPAAKPTAAKSGAGGKSSKSRKPAKSSRSKAARSPARKAGKRR